MGKKHLIKLQFKLNGHNKVMHLLRGEISQLMWQSVQLDFIQNISENVC